MNIALKLVIAASCCAVALGFLMDSANFLVDSALPGAQAAATGNGVVRWTGTGVQIYACKRDGERFMWSFERPEATLADGSGRVEARHGAGPSWTAGDGSVVYGTVVMAVPAPTKGVVPWLVLRASKHDGAGLMSGVTYIFRTDTDGGAAPLAGCDASHDGDEVRIPYHAVYTFLLEVGGPTR